MRRRQTARITVLLIAAAAALLALSALFFVSNRCLQTEYFSYASPALGEEFDGFRIVHLSDLHGAVFGKDNETLFRAVADAAPDVIFLTGDLVEGKTRDRLAYTESVGRALSAIAPTYYVTGNHEWALGTDVAEEVKKTLTETGVRVLSNEYEAIERGDDALVIAGVDDPLGYADQETPEELADALYAEYGDPFWLLLAHRNDRFDGGYCRLGADLTFSGHAHGGLIRLPGTDGLVGTHHELFPSFTAGFYSCTCPRDECDGAEVFISRGVGNVAWTLRLFNRPQVAVITLKKGS
ncbi:MAG: metallophosphoesterase [Oscillibacter sp.]|nr:metallophosphoesterase [Oscillibacter sp.]